MIPIDCLQSPESAAHPSTLPLMEDILVSKTGQDWFENHLINGRPRPLTAVSHILVIQRARCQ